MHSEHIYKELFDKSDKSFTTARYLLFQTYPSLNDSKLLITILNHLVIGLDYLITSVLEYERSEGRIPPYNKTNFDVKLELFRRRISDRYGVDKKLAADIREMAKIRDSHKGSAMEFARKGKYVIADDEFKLEVITEKKIKEFYNLCIQLQKIIGREVIRHGV